MDTELKTLKYLQQLNLDNNQLNYLDLRYNTALQSLSCKNNEISGLVINSLPELSSLAVGGNALSTLSLSPSAVIQNWNMDDNAQNVRMAARWEEEYGEWTIEINSLSLIYNEETKIEADESYYGGRFHFGDTLQGKQVEYIFTASPEVKLKVTMTPYDPNAPEPTPKTTLATGNVTLSGTSFTYSGSEIRPSVTVTVQKQKLIQGTDYSVTYRNNKNAAAATAADRPCVIVKGEGEYTGTVEVPFTIKPLGITALAVALPDRASTGQSIEFNFAANAAQSLENGYITPTLKVGAVEAQPLYLGQDYTVGYANNKNTGKATVTFTGKGNYTGSVKKNFNITAQPDIKKTFKDKAFADYVSKNIDKDGNGKLSDEEIAAVTEIVYHEPGIKDMTGVGIFTNLKTLIIGPERSENGYFPHEKMGTVSKLDVSKNLALEKLDCANNCLSSLDVSKNTRLQYLDCFNNGYLDERGFLKTATLKTLTLGTVSNLTHLDCSLGALKTLDLSGCSQLRELNVAANLFTSLDLSGSPALRTLDCQMCQDLHDMDLHACTQLDSLSIGGTALIRLDLSQNQAITYFDLNENGLYLRDWEKPLQPLEWNEEKKAWLFDLTPLVGEENLTKVLGVYTYTGTDAPDQPIEWDNERGIVTYRGTKWDGSFYFVYDSGNDNCRIRAFVNEDFNLNKKQRIDGNGYKVILELPQDENGEYYTNYTGSKITPKVTVQAATGDNVLGEPFKLKQGTDYKVTISNNTNVGTAVVTVTGIGGYTKSTGTEFSIKQADLSEDTDDTKLTVTAKTVTFNGSKQTPTVTVKWGKKTLKATADYEVSQPAEDDWTKAGSHGVTIKFNGNYKGIREVPGVFTINRLSISGLKVTLPAQTYGSYSLNFAKDKNQTDGYLTPKLKVGTEKEHPLYEDSDYTVAYLNTKDVGTASVMFIGTGNYTGTVTKTFKTNAKDISKGVDAGITVHFENNAQMQQYTGKAILLDGDIVVYDGETPLVLDRDYTLSYKNNTNVWLEGDLTVYKANKQPTVTITGKGNYKGKLTEHFEIEKGTFGVDWTGKAWTVTVTSATAANKTVKSVPKPSVKIVDAEGTVIKSTEYTVTGYENEQETYSGGGIITLKIESAGKNYEGGEPIYKDWVIGQKLSSAKINWSKLPKSETYTGDPIVSTEETPWFTVKDKDGNDLLQGENGQYTVSYENNINAGTAKIILTGTGEAGTGTNGIHYSGTVSKTFKIAAKPLTGAAVEVTGSYTYTGKAHKPDAEVEVKLDDKTLVMGTDYTVSYKNNTKVGAATVTVKGKGNYSGSATGKFSIGQAVLSEKDGYQLIVTSKVYNKKAQKPTVKVLALDGSTVKATEYEIVETPEKYKKGYTDPGAYEIKVQGKGKNYIGSLTGKFYIGDSITKAVVDGIVPSVEYTGGKITQDGLRVILNGETLKEHIVDPKTGEVTQEGDYTVRYESNINKGTAKVIIEGKTNEDEKNYYAGTITKTFKITAKSLANAEVEVNGGKSYTYTGKALKPDSDVKVTVPGIGELKLGTDYTLSYKNNKRIGTATVTVKGKGNYSGVTAQSFAIKNDASTEP